MLYSVICHILGYVFLPPLNGLYLDLWRYTNVLIACVCFYSDINECLTGAHECTGTNQRCENAPGTYSCVCAEGYQFSRISRSCEGMGASLSFMAVSIVIHSLYTFFSPIGLLHVVMDRPLSSCANHFDFLPFLQSDCIPIFLYSFVIHYM